MVRQLTWLVFAALAAVPGQKARADLMVPSNSTVATLSYAEIDTSIDTAVTKTVQSYATELDYGFQGASALSKTTYSVAVSDPAFQSAIGAAVATLLGDGAASTLGPKLLSSAATSSTAKQTVQIGRTAASSIVTGRFVGPAVFTSGNRGVCQSQMLVNTTPGLSGGTVPGNLYPLLSGCTDPAPSVVTLAFGAVDYDTLLLTLADIATTTTTTTAKLLTQVYRIDGVMAAGVTNVPAPPSGALLAGVFAAGGIVRAFARRGRA